MSSTEGALRRRIELRTRVAEDGSGEARGALEDDYHHFRVSLRHDGRQVTHTDSGALRFPYVTCPAAGGELTRLVGMALSSVANSVVLHTDAKLHCTHMLDLAGLAVAAAARGIARRTYDCTVPDRIEGVTHPALERDGAPVLRWTVDRAVILSPAPYADRELRAGFAGWALRTLAEDEVDVWSLLHRINVLTAVTACKTALPHLLASGAGRIVNVGAYAAAKAGAGMGPYTASKAAVAKLTESLAEELKGQVTVNAVLPSTIDTPTNRADMPDVDPATWVRPQDVAAAMLWLASREAGAVTGTFTPLV